MRLMAHRIQPGLWLCLVGSGASTLACGDIFFSSNPAHTGVSTLRIDSLAVQFVASPGTLTAGDSGLVRIRVVNSANVDVTAFVDSIYWSADPVQVIALAGGKTLGANQRYVRAIAKGAGSVGVSAVYLKPPGDIRIVSPVAQTTISVE